MGYVNINTSQKDKRVKELYTTSLTKKNISEIYGIRRDWWHHITQDLTPQEIEIFSKYYQTLSNHARTYADLEQTDLQFYELKKLSLSDYDSHLCCSLYTGGCNLKCPGCIVSNLVFLKENLYPISSEEISSFLKSHRKNIDGIYISGGEPLMHEGILPFLKYAKSLDFKIKLQTNGLFYERLKEIIENNLIDCVRLDIKNAPDEYAKSCGVDDIDLDSIDHSLRLLKQNRIENEVSITLIEEFHNKKNIQKLAKWLKGIQRLVLIPYKNCPTSMSQSLHAPNKEDALKYKQMLEKNIQNVTIKGEFYD